jgi:hypothetical protein
MSLDRHRVDILPVGPSPLLNALSYKQRLIELEASLLSRTTRDVKEPCKSLSERLVIVNDGNGWNVSHAPDSPKVLPYVVCFRRDILREPTYAAKRPNWHSRPMTDFEHRLWITR